MTDAYGQRHWNRARYRGPDHPVVRLFAESKLAMFERTAPGLPWAGGDPLVLDLGAGPGVFTAPLLRRFARVVALDVHDRLLSRNPAPWRLRGDALRLPFADASFDVLFLGNLLHHLDAPVDCLAECRRVMQPGAALLSVEPNRRHPLMFAFGLAVAEERRLLAYSPSHLRHLAQRAGLRVAAHATTGQIFQNKTPPWLLPLLAPLERLSYPLGAYQLAVMRKS